MVFKIAGKLLDNALAKAHEGECISVEASKNPARSGVEGRQM